ncbi:MAG: FHA domain-containing protein [Verrucomicrobia bacterium]|nr:FHA domain-containing protein [Verrucomicrobiota bacterium]
MVQLRVLNGSRAGAAHATSRFPCTIGRSTGDDLQLAEAGVWENHLQLDLQVPAGFRLCRLGQGRASVNGTEFDEVVLHNGDVIELGAVKVQFWLAEVRQSDNRARETLVWLGLGGLVLLECALIWLLL